MLITIDEESQIPLYIQLYEQIKADILNGVLAIGTKLKSSRALSAELRISRNTVELAYGQLYSEGFLISKPRRGFFVDLPLIEHTDQPITDAKTNAPNDDLAQMKEIRYDFQNKYLNPSEFPFSKWKALLNQCIHHHLAGMLEYGCPFGEPGLRSEIQQHLYRYRRVKCSAKQIIIAPGTQFCLDLICSLLAGNHGKIAIEEPGYHRTRNTFQNCGAEICPVPLDESGISTEQLQAFGVAATYVTPSHQYPMGIVMPMERRKALAKWAKNNNTYIIEDDYNSSFQYDLKPIPSIQSLCQDHVIYIGSFSELLFPSIGIAFMVLPEKLLDEMCASHCHNAIFAPFLTQKTLELFIREGLLESHIRKMIKCQRAKRDLLVEAIQNEFGGRVRIAGTQAGLHLLIHIQWKASEGKLIQKAREAGIALQSASVFWNNPQQQKKLSFLLHYGGMRPDHIPEAVHLLKKAWS